MAGEAEDQQVVDELDLGHPGALVVPAVDHGADEALAIVAQVRHAREVTIERRRELLFERCDERLDALPPNRDPSLADDLVAPMEELRHRAAEEARRQILRFIRDRAPQGSDAAFTAAELRRLNARRRSVETFAPYASP